MAVSPTHVTRTPAGPRLTADRWRRCLQALILAVAASALLRSPASAAPQSQFEVRCRDGQTFSWRLHGSGPYTTSQSNRQHLPAFGPDQSILRYDLKVDRPSGWFHRSTFELNDLRGAEHLSSGIELSPREVLDERRVLLMASLPLLLSALLLWLQRRQSQVLERGLQAATSALSEAEARTGLFPMDGSLPRRIHHYEVVSKLGAGGMAVVYEVQRDQTHYALKLPLPNVLDDEEFRARFVREMKTGMRLLHPNIVQIYDMNPGDGEFGYPYMVMELVSGMPLKQRMRQAPLDAPSVVRLGLEVLDALTYLHNLGIVHRDIKPANLMVTQAGHVKLMDFGIAFAEQTTGGRLTATGNLLGTPLYLAPEQITSQSQSTDPRVDIYGLGVVLYETLAGRLPWDHQDTVAAVMAKMSADPPALHKVCPGLPVQVSTVILQMMARNPEHRPATAAEARLWLAEAATHPGQG